MESRKTKNGRKKGLSEQNRDLIILTVSIFISVGFAALLLAVTFFVQSKQSISCIGISTNQTIQLSCKNSSLSAWLVNYEFIIMLSLGLLFIFLGVLFCYKNLG